MTNVLWLAWAIVAFGGFAVLEFLALRQAGGLEPLTYWVRAGISASPALIGAGLFMGFSWLVFHFFMENSIRGWKHGKVAGKRVADRIRAKRREGKRA
jgi:hypothetical protein